MEREDRIYWLRVLLALVAGVVSAVFMTPEMLENASGTVGISIGVFFYLLSYYGVKYGLKIDPESSPDITANTLLLTGVGSYVLTFLFTWVLLSNLLI